MNTQSLVDFRSSDSGSMARVRVRSIVEDRAIQEFQKELHEYVSGHPGADLHLDLSRVRFFSTAVLLDLLEIKRELQETKGSLRLHGVHGNVRNILKLAGLDKFLNADHRHVFSKGSRAS